MDGIGEGRGGGGNVRRENGARRPKHVTWQWNSGPDYSERFFSGRLRQQHPLCRTYPSVFHRTFPSISAIQRHHTQPSHRATYFLRHGIK